jgi:NCS1 family nucleobase:cation symporter-1
VGPRLGVPSVIAARAALGIRGASLLALVLYVTNFAWIALNNVIAAAACSRAFGPPGSERAWAVLLGILATGVVALGPRAVGLADRAAVPLMLAAAAILASGLSGFDPRWLDAPGTGGMSAWSGLDVVVGYQVSWILMFADYSRYTPSPRKGALAVFLGLLLPSLWLMSTGVLLSAASGSRSPSGLLESADLGITGAVLVALASVTTNFVNVYLSALAWRSLCPRTRDAASVWSIGLAGAALSLWSRGWLDRYADFMLLLGSVLVPAGGVLLSRLVLSREAVDPRALYDEAGPLAGFDRAGVLAWALGIAAYHAASALGLGSTLPGLLVAAAADSMLRVRRDGTRRSSPPPPAAPSSASSSRA